MSAAVFSRHIVIIVCDEHEEYIGGLQDGLRSMGFSVVKYNTCDQAQSFSLSKMGDVHVVIAGCGFSSGPTDAEAIEVLYRHFLGVPMTLLAEGCGDAAHRFGTIYGFSVLTLPVELDQLARVLVKAHFDRPS
ncbi:hypothetical protein [Azospirillum sp. A39]|uniref:hypothetical protein n=1 Tax=Azospirillum sp. A39 TaxID=3462279 RepID=UPI004045C786